MPIILVPLVSPVAIVQKADPAAPIKKQYGVMAHGWQSRNVKTITSAWASDYTEIQNIKGKTKTVTRSDATKLVQAMLKKFNKIEMSYAIQSLQITDGGKKATANVTVAGTVTVGTGKDAGTATMTAKFTHLWVSVGKEWQLKQQTPFFPQKK